MKITDELIGELDLLNFQNLSGREDMHEVFQEGIRVGIEFAHEWYLPSQKLPKFDYDVLEEFEAVLVICEEYNYPVVSYYDAVIKEWYKLPDYGRNLKVIKWQPINWVK